MRKPVPVCYTSLMKIVAVIDSCKTPEQLRVAFNMAKRVSYHPQWLTCLDSLVDKCDVITNSKSVLLEIASEHHLRHSLYKHSNNLL
jgi:hypothetical protein